MKFLLLGLFLIHSITLLTFAQEESVYETISSTDVLEQQPVLKVQEKTSAVSIAEIQSMLEKLSVEISSISQTTVLLARYYVALSKKIDEITRRYDELISLITTSEPYPEEETKNVQQDITSQQKTQVVNPQYVKVKVKDGGQEMEFSVDPTYLDMNLELKRKTVEEIATQQTEKLSTTSSAGQQKPTYKTEQKISQADKEELMKYIETSLKSLEKKQDVTQEIPKDVLDDLLTAQKLFYKKRYSEALKIVQRSLAKQETAIGYSIEGSLYFVLGDIDAAVNSWNKALELDPNMDDVREALFKYARSRLRR